MNNSYNLKSSYVIRESSGALKKKKKYCDKQSLIMYFHEDSDPQSYLYSVRSRLY
jgi:hypothetical protein